ncbi:MAG: 50S ribosomal protein L35 [bacterium]
MKLKTHKSISKRFQITKTKKVLHRAPGQDHFNARENGKTIKNKRRDKVIVSSYVRTIKAAMQ